MTDIGWRCYCGDGSVSREGEESVDQREGNDCRGHGKVL